MGGGGQASLLGPSFKEGVSASIGGGRSKGTRSAPSSKAEGFTTRVWIFRKCRVRVIGTTAILLNRIRLVAVVGGNEVTNPFVVTEVYVQQDGAWKLGSLSFTRLLTP